MIEFASAAESVSQIEAWKLWFDGVDISTKTIFFDISIRNWARIGKLLQAGAALAVVLDIIGAPALRQFGNSLRNVLTLGRARYLAVLSFQIFGDAVFPKNALFFRLDQIRHQGRRTGALIISSVRPGLKREQRKAYLARLFGRNLPVLMASKKGLRRLNRYRARVFPASIKLLQIERQIIIPGIAITSGILAIAFYILAFRNDYPTSLAFGLIVAFFFILVVFLAISIFLYLVVVAIHLLLPVLLIMLALIAFAADILIVEPVARVIGHPKNENLIKLISIAVFLVGFYFDLLAS
jgi:hypothetical protein